MKTITNSPLPPLIPIVLSGSLAAGLQGADVAIRLVDVAEQAGLTLLNICGGPLEGLHRRRERERSGVLRLRQRRRHRCPDRQRLDAGEHETGRRPDGRALQERRKGTLCRRDARQRSHERAAGAWGPASPTTTTTAFRTSTSPRSVRTCSFRNNGDGTFSNVTARAGLGDPRWGTNCAFADYDRDGDLDLYVANYLAFSERTIPKRGASAQLQVHGCRRDVRPKGPGRRTGRPLPQQRRRNVHGCHPLRRHRRSRPSTASACSFPIWTTTGGRTSSWRTIRFPTCCFATTATVRFQRSASLPASR